MLQDKVGVGKHPYSKKDVGRKSNQAYKQLSALSSMRSQRAELDREALIPLRNLLNMLIDD